MLSAPPASATQEEYLNALADKYQFLSDQQLITEGTRVCASEAAGTLAPDRTAMVQSDLQVNVNVAMEIVSAAEWNLC